jgi:prevent-host-death family protein
MSDPVFSADVRPMSDLKTRSSDVVDQVNRTHRPVLITRRGRGVAVMLDLAAFERMQDELAFGRALDEGAKQAREGDFAAPSEVERILRKRK